MIKLILTLFISLQLYPSIEQKIHCPIFNQHTIDKTTIKNLQQIKQLHPHHQCIIYSNHLLNKQKGFTHKTISTNDPLITSLEIIYEQGGILIHPGLYLKKSLLSQTQSCNLLVNHSKFKHLPQHTQTLLNPSILAASKKHPLIKKVIENINNCKPMIYSNNDLESKQYYFYHKYLATFHNTLKNETVTKINTQVIYKTKPFNNNYKQDPINISNFRWAKKMQTLILYFLIQIIGIFLFLVLKKRDKQYNQ